MRFLKTLAFAGFVLALASCDQNGGSGEATTPGGFPYTLHTNGDGQKPNVGDYVLFHIRQMKGDEVMFDSERPEMTKSFRFLKARKTILLKMFWLF
ncbi:MAG: hypothetical protein R2769_12210 [Saprospiraceae bacterium]